MTSRDAVTIALVLLAPTLAVIGARLARRIDLLIETYVKDRTLAAKLVALNHAADDAVAFVYQTMVAALKDPNKPGAWNEVAQHAAKDAAVDAVRRAVPQLVADVGASGVDVDAVLSQKIERAVVDLNAKVGTPPAACPPVPPAPVIAIVKEPA